MSSELEVAVLDGVLVIVAITFCLFSQVERTTLPSAVALKWVVMQLDQRDAVELPPDVDGSSAVNCAPMLYPHAAMELSFSGIRMPPS
jgi:hypothetical protein